MKRLLPAQPPTSYPWGGVETLGQWDCAIASLCEYRLDFDGAEALYRQVLRDIPKSTESVSRHSARYGLALVLAAKGKFAEAVEQDSSAGGEYYTWCGNCAEGEGRWIDDRRQVWAAGQGSFDSAYANLLSIVDGRVAMPLTSLFDSHRRESAREVSEPLAALTLGQLCMRNGRLEDARKLFRFAASFDSGEAPRIALGYCRELGVLEQTTSAFIGDIGG
jgi:hypothetical protein